MAYIQYDSEAGASKAIAEMNQIEIKGKKIDVNKHEKKGIRSEQSVPAKFNNLFVKNFPQGTTDEELKKLFQEFGEIDSVGVMTDAEGKLKN
jgi:polyadenylate-binding protein